MCPVLWDIRRDLGLDAQRLARHPQICEVFSSEKEFRI
jgi:hypothetical protein